MNDASPALPQPNWLGAHRRQPQTLHPSHWCFSPMVFFPAHPSTCLTAGAVKLSCMAGRGRLSQHSHPSLSKTGEACEGGSSKSSFHFTAGMALTKPCIPSAHLPHLPHRLSSTTIAAWKAEGSHIHNDISISTTWLTNNTEGAPVSLR